MAYCVHCGVKLESCVRRCPLCGTIVLDPSAPPSQDVSRAYPVRTPEQELKRNKWFLLTLAVILLLVPALLCLLVDWLTSGGLRWSIYAAGALILLFISVAVPLLLPRNKIYWSMLAAYLCLNAYLFMTEQLSESSGWFFPIVLPALALGTGMIALATTLYRRDYLNKLTLLAVLLLAVAIECLAIEGLCKRALGLGVYFAWSPYVVAPCVFVALLLFFVNANRSVREEVRRRVHF